MPNDTTNIVPMHTDSYPAVQCHFLRAIYAAPIALQECFSLFDFLGSYDCFFFYRVQKTVSQLMELHVLISYRLMEFQQYDLTRGFGGIQKPGLLESMPWPHHGDVLPTNTCRQANVDPELIHWLHSQRDIHQVKTGELRGCRFFFLLTQPEDCTFEQLSAALYKDKGSADPWKIYLYYVKKRTETLNLPRKVLDDPSFQAWLGELTVELHENALPGKRRVIFPDILLEFIKKKAHYRFPYVCPLTLRLIDDPVVARDNVVYERRALESLFKQAQDKGEISVISPVIRKKMDLVMFEDSDKKSDIDNYRNGLKYKSSPPDPKFPSRREPQDSYYIKKAISPHSRQDQAFIRSRDLKKYKQKLRQFFAPSVLEWNVLTQEARIVKLEKNFYSIFDFFQGKSIPMVMKKKSNPLTQDGWNINLHPPQLYGHTRYVDDAHFLQLQSDPDEPQYGKFFYVNQYNAIRFPLTKLKKNFTDMFQSYTVKRLNRDFFMPVYGVLHLVSGFISLIGGLIGCGILMLGGIIMLPIWIGLLCCAQCNGNSPLYTNLVRVRSYYLALGAIVLSWIGRGVTESIWGCAQILITPLVWFRMIFIRPWVSSSFENEKIQSLIEETTLMLESEEISETEREKCILFLYEIHRKYETRQILRKTCSNDKFLLFYKRSFDGLENDSDFIREAREALDFFSTYYSTGVFP